MKGPYSIGCGPFLKGIPKGTVERGVRTDMREPVQDEVDGSRPGMFVP